MSIHVNIRIITAHSSAAHTLFSPHTPLLNIHYNAHSSHRTLLFSTYTPLRPNAHSSHRTLLFSPHTLHCPAVATAAGYTSYTGYTGYTDAQRRT